MNRSGLRAQIGWHGATIHSVAFFPDKSEFALDLDYIFQWVEPKKEGGYYKFRVAPVTMVFENVYDLLFDIDTSAGLEIDDLNRSDPTGPRNAGAIRRETEWERSISLKSVGYKMYVRRAPTLQRGQSLKSRGGTSFARSA